MKDIRSEFDLAEELATKVMRWVSESEDISKSEFAVTRLFESGVLPENTKGFLHSLLELQFPGDRTNLELPPEELHTLVSEAFKQTYLYLLSPQSFLTDFLLFGNDHLTIDSQMLCRLGYLVDYPYFTDMIDEWLGVQLKKGAKIPKTDFQEFLTHVDRSVMEHSPIEDIISYLNPLYDFKKTKVLASDELRTFFEDKNLVLNIETKKEFLIEEAAQALKNSFRQPEMTPNQEPIATEYGAFLKELRDIGVILPAPKPAGDNSPPPIEMFISKKLRLKSLEKIFHNNTKDYEHALGVLNASSDYPQAELNLRTLLDIYKIDPDSKTSRRLHKALRLKFNIPIPLEAD